MTMILGNFSKDYRPTAKRRAPLEKLSGKPCRVTQLLYAVSFLEWCEVGGLFLYISFPFPVEKYNQLYRPGLLLFSALFFINIFGD